MVPTAVVLLVQVPPDEEFDKVTEEPAHMLAEPVIAGAQNIVVKLTVAVFVAVYPLIVKPITAPVTVAELVRVAVYVPSLLSVTTLTVPAVVVTPTTPPDAVRFTPAAVFN